MNHNTPNDEPQPGELVRFWPPCAVDFVLVKFNEGFTISGVRYASVSTQTQKCRHVPAQYICRQPEIKSNKPEDAK